MDGSGAYCSSCVPEVLGETRALRIDPTADAERSAAWRIISLTIAGSFVIVFAAVTINHPDDLLYSLCFSLFLVALGCLMILPGYSNAANRLPDRTSDSDDTEFDPDPLARVIDWIFTAPFWWSTLTMIGACLLYWLVRHDFLLASQLLVIGQVLPLRTDGKAP